MKIEKRYYAAKEVIVRNGGILPMSLSSVYAAIKKGQIPSIKVGKKMMIPYWFLESLLKEPAVQQEKLANESHDEIELVENLVKKVPA